MNSRDCDVRLSTRYGVWRGVVCGAALAAYSATGQAQVVADSAAQFSSVQGANGWSYGYYDGDPPSPFAAADFEPFPNFDATVPPGVWMRTLGAGGYWTAINRTACHPNSSPSSGGRLSEWNWAVRRWTSPATMPVRITGHIADAGAGGGNGIVAKVIVAGAVRYERLIQDGDTVGVDFSIETCVAGGTIIDFCVTANGSDQSDGTIFTASVQGPISGQPQDTSVCEGGSAGFAIEVTGPGPFRYQWYKNGAVIEGATGATLGIADVGFDDEADYSCDVSVFACGHVLSTAAKLKVCLADLNCDEQVDFVDYLEFLTYFDAGDLKADMNRDGLVDFSDYLDFVNMYDVGC